ncbi:PepSY-like domain-containing protein [Pedobacter rhizosphaerae]|uniref:Putative beta-lactamase-inhibitor-like, PepSY-like n=1 Tax=Pedobacter rhizosphaerae TaxID=390241 RepID=A0A1H9QN72_9SPHI|nr:PepSY-like domain-containing protein [Pedobacter rhizosphaerae]SER61193.1 Putative beta-lactamase-inhibitor-like, PepSY-like [Pedobacter rhizosphaerae]
MMKNTFKILPALLLFSASLHASPPNRFDEEVVMSTTLFDHKPVVQVSLPKTALAFIQKHFGKTAVREVKAKKSPTPQGTFYEVKLADDTEIDFGKAGNWIEAKAEEPNKLPTSFFPGAIQAYLKKKFSGIGVESIDKSAAGYKLELTNDTKLYFNANGGFLRKKK